MRFMLPRNRTITSTCGISIEFKKGELHLVPPAMYAEVIAAGGVPETELEEADLPPQPASPEAIADRMKQIHAAFEKIVARADRMEFTAGGMPHNAVLSREVGWTVQAKERDAAWIQFTSDVDSPIEDASA